MQASPRRSLQASSFTKIKGGWQRIPPPFSFRRQALVSGAVFSLEGRFHVLDDGLGLLGADGLGGHATLTFQDHRGDLSVVGLFPYFGIGEIGDLPAEGRCCHPLAVPFLPVTDSTVSPVERLAGRRCLLADDLNCQNDRSEESRHDRNQRPHKEFIAFLHRTFPGSLTS